MLYLIQASLLPLCTAAALATGIQEPRTPQDPTTEARPEASIDDFAWLAGHWRGKGFGGVCEEIWSRPLAGTMVGTFRLIQEGKIVFYEIMVLGPDAKGMALKVKHFSADFVAWEEKKGAVRFGLESVQPGKALFGGLKMHRKGDKLDIAVKMGMKDGSSHWEPIALRRSPPEKK